MRLNKTTNVYLYSYIKYEVAPKANAIQHLCRRLP